MTENPENLRSLTSFEAWMAHRVEALSAHFFQPEMGQIASAMILNDWIKVLGHIPQQTIEAAIIERLSQDGSRRPTPGEILGIAERMIARENPVPRLRVVDDRPFGPRPKLSEAELTRRRKVAADAMAQIGNPIRRVMNSVCEKAEISIDRLTGVKGSSRITNIRAIAMLLAKEICRHGPTEIGRQFNRDHSTANHAFIRARGIIQDNEEMRALYEAVKAEFA